MSVTEQAESLAGRARTHAPLGPGKQLPAPLAASVTPSPARPRQASSVSLRAALPRDLALG